MRYHISTFFYSKYQVTIRSLYHMIYLLYYIFIVPYKSIKIAYEILKHLCAIANNTSVTVNVALGVITLIYINFLKSQGQFGHLHKSQGHFGHFPKKIYDTITKKCGFLLFGINCQLLMTKVIIRAGERITDFEGESGLSLNYHTLHVLQVRSK